MPSDLSRACSIPFYDNDGFLVANSLDCVGPYEAAPCRARVSVGGVAVSPYFRGTDAPVLPVRPCPENSSPNRQCLTCPQVRAWGDEFSTALQRSMVESVRQAQAISRAADYSLARPIGRPGAS